jgi:hypothetical protein
MAMAKGPNLKKAAKHEAKGDELTKKGKHKKALAEYKKSLEYDPARPGIFDKLIESKDKIEGDWKMEDFAESMSWTMGKQELANPSIKQIHAMLSPEWNVATEIAFKILASSEGRDVSDEIEKLVGMGEIATRALVNILLSLTRSHEENPDEAEDEKHEV